MDTQVYITGYKKDQLKILTHSWDLSLSDSHHWESYRRHCPGCLALWVGVAWKLIQNIDAQVTTERHRPVFQES